MKTHIIQKVVLKAFGLVGFLLIIQGCAQYIPLTSAKMEQAQLGRVHKYRLNLYLSEPFELRFVEGKDSLFFENGGLVNSNAELKTIALDTKMEGALVTHAKDSIWIVGFAVEDHFIRLPFTKATGEKFMLTPDTIYKGYPIFKMDGINYLGSANANRVFLKVRED